VETKRRLMIVIREFLPSLGGAQQRMARHALGLKRRGWEVQILTSRFDPSLAREETWEGIPIHRIASPKIRWLGTFLYLRRLARELRARRGSYDVILTMMIKHSAAAATPVARRLGKKIAIQLACMGPVGDLAQLRRVPFGRRLLARCKGADRFVVSCSPFAEELRAEGFAPERIRLVLTGTPLRPLPTASEKEALRRRLRLPEGRLILYVGRLSPEKRVLRLLEAAQPVLDETPDVHLILLGDGPERDAVERRVDQLGVGARVHLRGTVNNVGDYLAVGDVFVLPSLTESLSLALVEAMAAGLPVITTRQTGAVDAVKNGENGLLVDVDDMSGLTAAMSKVLQDPEWARQLGEHARRTIENEFTVDRMNDRYEQVYEEMLAEGSGE
jgi:glycosyltransferase involved in cell wall biosynthesis